MDLMRALHGCGAGEVSNNAYRFDGSALMFLSLAFRYGLVSSASLSSLYNDTFTPTIASRPEFVQGRKQHLTSEPDQHV